MYLAAEPVDLRRGHDGLVAIVRSEWRLNPFDGHLFVFLGRRLDRVKISCGIATASSSTTSGCPRAASGCRRSQRVSTRVEMDATTLAMLLDGIDVKLRATARNVGAAGAISPPA